MNIPDNRCQTISVAEAGARLGLSRVSAYRAARCGQLPTLRFGKRLVIPLPAFEALLRGKGEA